MLLGAGESETGTSTYSSSSARFDKPVSAHDGSGKSTAEAAICLVLSQNHWFGGLCPSSGQWLRLARYMGTNRVGFSLPSPEDGNR
jgi:hypothetical protein